MILLGTARSMMFQSGLPIRFWPYFILIATWIQNRLLSRVLNWISPYEVLFQEAPDYSQIKPFGCLAYVANIIPHKFDTRSIKSIFIGFDSSHKEFLLYDLENDKVFISRDVKFVTDTFPFISPTPNQSKTTMSLPAVSNKTNDAPQLDNEDFPSSASHPSFPEISIPDAADELNNGDELNVGDQPPLRRNSRIKQPPVFNLCIM